jgi:cell wall-associated NlpC family hydrolase
MRRRRITIQAMRFSAKAVAAVTLCGLALSASSAQPQIQQDQGSDETSQIRRERENESRRPAPVELSADDGLSVIAAALDAHVQATRPRDCSHLVHAIYTKAGFPYPYASSSDLYDGLDEFQRVPRPQPGDLVVWPGHVGIVVNPARRVFFSRLRHGPGIDLYDTQYWKTRGSARFFRYVTSRPADVAATHPVVGHRRK